MIEMTNDTYGYGVLPPRKETHKKRKVKTNVSFNPENSIEKEEVKSRIEKREQNKKKNNNIVINIITVSFFLVLFGVYCFNFLK